MSLLQSVIRTSVSIRWPHTSGPPVVPFNQTKYFNCDQNYSRYPVSGDLGSKFQGERTKTSQLFGYKELMQNIRFTSNNFSSSILDKCQEALDEFKLNENTEEPSQEITFKTLLPKSFSNRHKKSTKRTERESQDGERILLQYENMLEVPNGGDKFIRDEVRPKGMNIIERAIFNKLGKLADKTTPSSTLRARKDISAQKTGPRSPVPKRIFTMRNFLGVTGLIESSLFDTLNRLSIVDHIFSEPRFLDDCRYDFIPNILGAILAGNMRLIDDWCTGNARRELIAKEVDFRRRKLHRCWRLLSIEHVAIDSASWTHQTGPIIKIRFKSQQTRCMFDSNSKIIEGDQYDIVVGFYTWSLVRDLNESDPKAAWRLCEFEEETEIIQL